MTNKKTTSAKVAESNTTTLYPKKARRSRLDRRIKFLFILNCILALVLGVLSGMNATLRHDLNATLWHIEEAQAENDQLQEELAELQSENDEIQADYHALVTLLNNEEPEYREICSTGTFKSWMDYRAITDSSSKQWQLQQSATTDPYYGLRLYGEYVMVAMGPQYGPVGAKYLIQFQDRSVIKVIISDIKHQGCTSSDGSMLEMLVDAKVLPLNIKTSGNFDSVFHGRIIEIREVE